MLGSHGELNIAEVEKDCPPLLSVTAMKELGLVLDFKNQTITASILEGKTHRMETATSGHPILSIIDYQKEKGFPYHFMTYHAEGWVEPYLDCTQKDK